MRLRLLAMACRIAQRGQAITSVDGTQAATAAAQLLARQLRYRVTSGYMLNGSVRVTTIGRGQHQHHPATEATPVEAIPAEATATEVAQVEAIPAKATPVEAIPTKATPVEAIPVKATPAEAIQAEATLVEAIQAGVTPVEAIPTEALYSTGTHRLPRQAVT